MHPTSDFSVEKYDLDATKLFLIIVNCDFILIISTPKLFLTFVEVSNDSNERMAAATKPERCEMPKRNRD